MPWYLEEIVAPPKGLGPVIPKTRNCLGIWKKLLLRRMELPRLALDTDHAGVEVHNLWEVLLQYMLLEEWCAKKWLLLLSILLLNPRPNSGLRGSCYVLSRMFMFYLGTCSCFISELFPCFISELFPNKYFWWFFPYYVVK